MGLLDSFLGIWHRKAMKTNPSTGVIAKYLCELSGWSLTNLKLQKILYLSHMVHLGTVGTPLLGEKFQAWDLGPVLPGLYHEVKIFGNEPIQNIFYKVPDPSPEVAAFLKRAWDALGKRSASQLVSMTHDNGGAWAKHYRPEARGVVIPDEDILAEYQSKGQKRA